MNLAVETFAKTNVLSQKNCIALVERIINIPIFILANFFLWYFIMG